MWDPGQHHGNACHTWLGCMQELQSRHQHQSFHHFFLIQEHPIVSADSASSQPYPDSVRHLPDNTGVWSAVVLAGPEADAVEDAHSSFHETRTPHKAHRDLETQCVCDLVCVRFCSQGMTWSSRCSVGLDMSALECSVRVGSRRLSLR